MWKGGHGLGLSFQLWLSFGLDGTLRLSASDFSTSGIAAVAGIGAVFGAAVVARQLLSVKTRRA